LTCERGREGKCRREGLDILRHYLSQNTSSTVDDDKKELTLEEEIAMLQKGASSEQVLGDNGSSVQGGNSAFGVYETGCGGTVLIMCTLPNSVLIPPIRTEWSEANEGKRKASEQVEGNDAPKRARRETEEVVAEKGTIKENDKVEKGQDSQELAATATETASDGTPPWDPVETVQRVLKDLDSASTSAPSSRFVTRMIPIQATCFASLEEISLTSKALIDKYLKDETPSSFAVSIKRRNCSTVTRDEIINTVAGAVLDMEGHKKEWKVDLKSPKYTIMVEICKTLCGVTIIENCASYRKFNLLEIREAQQTTTKA